MSIMSLLSQSSSLILVCFLNSCPCERSTQRSTLTHMCLPPRQPACLPCLMTGCIISPIPPLTPHNCTIGLICPLCIKRSSWKSVLLSIRSQNHQQAISWFWLWVGPSQPVRAMPGLQSHYPTQEHRHREKYSNQYCILTSVWPLSILPTRCFPPQLK